MPCLATAASASAAAPQRGDNMPRGDGEDVEDDARPAAEQAAPRGDGRDAAAVALVVAAEDASLEREDTAAAAAA